MKYVLRLMSIAILLMMAWSLPALAQEASDSSAVEESALAPPQPVTEFRAEDHPNDHGHAVDLYWTPSVDDVRQTAGAQTVIKYEVFRWEPFLADTISRYRQLHSLVRSQANPGLIDSSAAASAMAALASGGVAAAASLFLPALPGDFDTADSVAQTSMYSAALSDTLAAMQQEYEISKDTTKAYRRRVLDAIGRLPAAYAEYPDPQAGTWKFIAVASSTSGYEHIGAKDRFTGNFFPDHTPLYYRVDALTADPNAPVGSAIAAPIESSGQWFNEGRLVGFIFVVIFTILLLYFVARARKGDDLYVRPMAGIEAVDDAIGRATEMGRPILYILGLGSASDVATIASFSILGRVAKKVAEYQTPLLVPTYDPIVMTVAQEVVKSAYMDAGRPDDYSDDIVYFVTQSQFAYVAAVNGMMLRRLPATNVYMGKFYAESLLLAETGALAGSIQIAGTDEIAQIPFFIVACDYTLIGEELYAASAYLGREPILLGSLKAQDYMKAAVILAALVGIFSAALDWSWYSNFFKIDN